MPATILHSLVPGPLMFLGVDWISTLDSWKIALVAIAGVASGVVTPIFLLRKTGAESKKILAETHELEILTTQKLLELAGKALYEEEQRKARLSEELKETRTLLDSVAEELKKMRSEHEHCRVQIAELRGLLFERDKRIKQLEEQIAKLEEKSRPKPRSSRKRGLA